MGSPRIAIGPKPAAFAEDAVRAGGGHVTKLGEPAEGLVWLSAHDTDCLREVLEAQPEIRWVQLPFAGVENVAEAGVLEPGRQWSSAKGSYAQPVAEHALTLALAGLRHLPERIRARSWGAPAGTSLYGADVTILGGGGIADELLRLLRPFAVRATVVRRQDSPVDGAARTLTINQLELALKGALVVFLALALTPETTRVIGRRQLEAMDERAWLINVARGRHVDTDALVQALHWGNIAGAGLDVTDPEPLPDGHPLWTTANCIITPHTADTWEMIVPLLAARIRVNVAHFVAGEPLEGSVDPLTGY
ncbi:MAG TPA: D-isomer specific 2-hydroxyacid dehydrogenase family protein [Acidimicrobiales bacterium]|nr:D-isomer specific 2-hydroxyacid dehydrogenase family protein [Acidimicrobiales bacterium]